MKPTAALRALRQSYRTLQQVSERLDRIEYAMRRRTGSPIEQYVELSYATRDDGLFDGTYDLWRVTRINKILSIYGLDELAGKRILELGAGHGDIGAFFAGIGAEVTCVDGREENLTFGRLKFRDVEGLSFVRANLDEDFRHLGEFDLILHLGLLYHIEAAEEHLLRCFELADEVILESVVCDSTDPYLIHLVDEDAGVNEDALSGRGSRPSPFFIERVAREAGFEIERYFTSDLNAGEYLYDWEHQNDGSHDAYRRRRFWRFRRPRK